MKKREIALLIPAHNEEPVIQATLQAAIKAGFHTRDIYVVNDDSSDKTYELAETILHENVLSAKRGGKGDALKSGVDHFNLLRKYRWLAMTDADTLLDINFKKEFRKKVREIDISKTIAICCEVKTLKASWISHYRSFEYAIGQDLYKQVESLINMVLVLPGCGTCFNTDYLSQINYLQFINDTLVEDYDLTVELHYKTKGKIIYNAKMVVWTQEPMNFAAYRQQIRRWYRGWFQVAKKRLSFPPKKIDFLIYYFSIDAIIFTLEMIGILSISLIKKDPYIIAQIFIIDFITIGLLALYAAVRKNRYEILAAFPLVYSLRMLNVYFFLRAGIDVYLFHKAPLKKTIWNVPRYQIST